MLTESKKRKTGDHFYKLLGEGRSSSKKKQVIEAKESNPLLLSSDAFNYKDNESYSSLIQMLKNDLMQIQEMINNNAQDIKVFKLLSKAPGLSKKLSEIEEQKSISHLIDKINEDSKKYEKIKKLYNCSDHKQLTQKIFVELCFNELLLKKIYDFFILMKLSLHKDDTYQESLSKIISIKSFVDKTIDTINTFNNKNNNADDKHNNKKIYDIILKINMIQELLDIEKKINKIPDYIKNIIKIITEYFKKNNENIIQKINSENNNTDYQINIIELENKSEIEKSEEIHKELIDIIGKYKSKYNEQSKKVEDLMNDIQEKDKIIKSMNENQNNDILNIKKELENEKKAILEKIAQTNEKYDQIEKEYNLLKEENNKLLQELNQYKEKDKNNIDNNIDKEKDLKEKDEKIENLEKTNKDLNNKSEELNNKIKELNTKINELNDTIKKLNEKINELEQKKNNNKNIDINKVIKDSEITNIINNYEKQLKQIGNELINKYMKEIKELEKQLKSVEYKYELSVLERESLKKEINHLKKNKYDPDSYEQVLKEQFETMRNAFTLKIENLNDELNDIKKNSRTQIYQLKLELEENVKLKNNFLKQIISLQSQLESLESLNK
jgi:chromosome segregation ATPase